MMKKIKYLLLMLFIAPIISLGFLSKNIQKNGLLREKMPQNLVVEVSFVDYWKNDFRKDDSGNTISICDITYDSYKEMYGKYVALDENERKTVDLTSDYEEGYTIKDSIKQLVERFDSPSSKDNKKLTLNHSNTIIIVVVVAVFGMSVICVFFALKNGNLIK